MSADLSTCHEPVSTLFGSAATLADDDLRLTDEQLQSFNDNGFLSGIRLLTDEQVDCLRSELASLMDPQQESNPLWHEIHLNESGDPDNVLFHALGAWRISPSFHDLLWNPAFVRPAQQLLGGSVRFWHDQLFCKPAHHGGVVAWHQDYSYWTRTEPMSHLTCWIALDDATVDNGCVQYIPGSHRWDLLPITGLAGDMESIRKVLTDDQWEQLQSPFPAELPKGFGVFHHPLTVHGSTINRTDRPRRAVVINAFTDGVRSASDEPLLAGIPPIPAGEKMEGRFFPLLDA